METWSLVSRYSHQAFLLERWKDQYGEKAVEALCQWNNEPAPVFGRMNPLARDQVALDRVRSETKPCLLGDAFPDFFRLSGAPDPEWIAKGLIYIQDPSTSLACRLRPCEAPTGAGLVARLAAGYWHAALRVAWARDGVRRVGWGDAGEGCRRAGTAARV